MRHALRGTVVFVLCGFAAAQSALLEELEENLPRNPPGVYGPLDRADFDGDGDPDLLRSDGVLFNDGGGRFSQIGNSPGGIFACVYFVAVADFDGDGDSDVIGYACGGGAMLALNNGNGTFLPAPSGPPLSPGIVSGFFDLHVADLNGDGKPDVVGGSSNASIFAWINLTGTTFSLVPFTYTGLVLGVLGSGDVDGDGDDDVVFANQITFGTVTFVVRTASLVTGAFILGPPLTPAAPSVSGGMGDWNNDGFADLVVSSAAPLTPPTDTLRLGAPGGLGPVVATSTHPDLAQAFVAFDRDGVPPLEAIRSGNQGLKLVSVGGAGASSILAQLPGVAQFSGPIVAADFDVDGDQDVIIATSAVRRRIAFSTPFAFVDPFGPFDAGFAAGGRILAFDVDADGDTDAVSLDLAEVRLNDGLGRFAATTSLGTTAPQPSTAYTACVLDFDGDGREDLFCPAAFPNTLSHTLYLTTPGLAWVQSSVASPMFAGVRSLPGDLDLDGDLDLVVVGSSNPFPAPATAQTSRLEGVVNLGGGAMALQVLDVTHRTTDAAVVDLDNDGDLDIVQASHSATTTPDPTVLRINTGSGAFVEAPFPPGVQAWRVAAGDLDGNGLADVVLDGVAWLNNGGVWTAAPLVATTPAGTFQWHQLADLDGNGFPELLEEAGWHQGFGATGFGSLTKWATQLPAIAGFPVRDLDRDGDPDVVLQSPTVVWNTTRHLARGSLARPGRVGSLEIFGAPFAAYQLVASLGPAAPPLAIPPYGTVFIDLGSAVPLPPGTLDPFGRATLQGFCPNNPALVGASLWWQAAMISEARITGIEETKILGL